MSGTDFEIMLCKFFHARVRVRDRFGVFTKSLVSIWNRTWVRIWIRIYDRVRLAPIGTIAVFGFLTITLRFVNDICTDFMTETDPASPCSFVDEKRSGQRICTEVGFKRKDCSKHANIKVRPSICCSVVHFEFLGPPSLTYRTAHFGQGQLAPELTKIRILTFHFSNNSFNWWLFHKLATPLIKGRNSRKSCLNKKYYIRSLDPLLRMKLCFIRSTMLSMFHLDKLKCNRGNQKVNIMITAPNQKACKYATHRNRWIFRNTGNKLTNIHQAAAWYQQFDTRVKDKSVWIIFN